MRFEWDPRKAESNFRKHGVSFESAVQVFADPFIRAELSEGPWAEERWSAIGSVFGALLYVVYAEHFREDEIHVRIISARRATRHERRDYEQGR